MCDVVERLKNWCTDWNGQQMVRGEPPRDGLHCDDLLDAADEIDRLCARIAALEADKARLVAALEFYAKLGGNGQNFRVVEPSKDGSFVSMGSCARAELDAVKGGGDER